MARKPRPFEYKPEYIDKVDQYLNETRDVPRIVVKMETGKGGTVYDEKVTVQLPTIEDFATYLGVARRSLYNWEKEFEDFGVALDRIRVEQLKRLLNNGLSGDYNPIIAKLLLSHNHGMKDRSDLTTGDKPLPLFDYAKGNSQEESKTD